MQKVYSRNYQGYISTNVQELFLSNEIFLVHLKYLEHCTCSLQEVAYKQKRKQKGFYIN